MTYRLSRILLSALCLVFVLAVSVRAQDWGHIRVVEPEMLNVRKGRDAGTEHVRTLYAGDMVRIDFPRDGWVAVFDVDTRERSEAAAIGFANVKFLVAPTKAQLAALEQRKPGPADPADPAGWGLPVTLSANIKVRQEPASDSEIVSVLVRGETAKVHGRYGDWLLAFRLGETNFDSSTALGWVHRDGLGLTAADMAGQPSVAAPWAAQQAEPAPVSSSATGPAVGPAPEPTPEPTPEPEQATDASEPVSASQAFASAPEQPEPEQEAREEHVLVVPQTVASQAAPTRPEADQQAHGFRYGIISKAGDDPLAKGMEIRVYLDVDVVPDSEDLRDFTSTIWKRDGDPSKQGAVLIYLPDQDLNGLAYAQGRFGPRGPGEFWTRETTLYGTRFK